MKKATTISRSRLARTFVVARLRTFAGAWVVLAAVMVVGIAFENPAAAQLSSNPGILIADFNHDGIPDALVPSPSTSTFTLSFGSVPFGTFGSVARSVAYPSGCTTVLPGTTVVGDFNGDGFPDIALTCSGSPAAASAYTIYILLGAGDGTFTQKSSVSGLTQLVGGDFNHDGKMDLVAVGGTGVSDGYSIIFFKGNGDGTLSTANTLAISTNYSSVLAVDLNQDGYPDLALGNFTNQSADAVDIFGNNKDGTFGTLSGNAYVANTSIPVGAYPSAVDSAILAGNFYGSGVPDLAVVDTGTSAPGIFVIQNNSTGTTFSFGDAAKTSVAGLQSAAAASFTTAFSDLLVYDGTNLTVFANDRTGKFTQSYDGLSVANTTPLYAAADANADGHADIFTATLTNTGASMTVDLVSGSATATSAPFSLPASPPASPTALNASWTGNINFNGSSAAGSQIVNALATAIALTSSKSPSITGDSVTFTATVTPNVSGNHIASGTVTFLDGTATLGMTALSSSGVAAFTTSALSGGSHSISAVYSGDTIFGGSLLANPLVQQVNTLTPTLTWPTPATIAYGTPLGSAQLDATATGATGGALPGTFAYTPAAGTILTPGVQKLSVVFTPTDAVSYTTATASVNITVTDVTLSSITPNTAQIGDPAKTITITGSGLVATTQVLVSGTGIPTALVNPTTLTAVIPAADFATPGTLEIALKNPATGSVTAAVTFTVTAPTLAGTLSGPPTTPPATQPTLNFAIPAAYPVDLNAALTLSLKSSLPSGATDSDNVVFNCDNKVTFCSNSEKTLTFTVPAGTTTVPTIQLQAGTVAETITVTPALTASGVDVTPSGLAPVTIAVPSSVPIATMPATLTRNGKQLTVVIVGYSNTREIVSASFHFTPAAGATLTTSDFSPPAADLFTTWYADPTSTQYGSSFTYTQNFTVSDDATNIGSVQVTLTNTVGVSETFTAQ